MSARGIIVIVDAGNSGYLIIQLSRRKNGL